MTTIQFFLDGVGFVGGGERQTVVPRVGETIVLGTARVEYKVTNVVWLQQAGETGVSAAQVHLARIQ